MVYSFSRSSFLCSLDQTISYCDESVSRQALNGGSEGMHVINWLAWYDGICI